MEERLLDKPSEYDILQRLQATSRSDTLQEALDQIQTLSQQRVACMGYSGSTIIEQNEGNSH